MRTRLPPRPEIHQVRESHGSVWPPVQCALVAMTASRGTWFLIHSAAVDSSSGMADSACRGGGASRAAVTAMSSGPLATHMATRAASGPGNPSRVTPAAAQQGDPERGEEHEARRRERDDEPRQVVDERDPAGVGSQLEAIPADRERQECRTRGHDERDARAAPVGAHQRGE